MKLNHSIILTSALLAGCVVGPQYAGAPQIGSTHSRFARAEDVSPSEPALAEWWTHLGDPVLTRIEELAIADNPGLAAAQARIAQARASARQERANRYPVVAAQATTVQAKLPGLDLQSNSPGQPPAPPDQAKQDDSLSVYNIGVNANWEIDFAGGQIRRIEAANALAAASVATAQDAQVQLTAEVARAYVGLREGQARLRSLQQERGLQQQVLELTEQRYRRGVLPLFAVGTASSELAAIDSGIGQAKADVSVFKDVLAVLAGQAPGTLDPMLDPPRGIPLPPASVSVGDPAALIARRPDIRAAERNIAAATARIGVAKAARFPKLSFMGILGLGGTSPDEVADLENLSAIAIPRLQWGLLDFGRTAAGIDQAKSGRDEAEARYREIVLRALQDAEQSLARFGEQRAAVAALAQIKSQADTAAKLNQQRYEAGAISKIDLNASLRERQRAQANLDRGVSALTSAWGDIQKALGLGWDTSPNNRRAENTPVATPKRELRSSLHISD
jgi:outer membrane protein, multidrug efflux system